MFKPKNRPSNSAKAKAQDFGCSQRELHFTVSKKPVSGTAIVPADGRPKNGMPATKTEGKVSRNREVRRTRKNETLMENKWLHRLRIVLHLMNR
jgi:hypothetical protein